MWVGGVLLLSTVGFFLISSILSLNDLLLLPYIFLSVLLLMLLLFLENLYSRFLVRPYSRKILLLLVYSQLGARHVSPRAVELYAYGQVTDKTTTGTYTDTLHPSPFLSP